MQQKPIGLNHIGLPCASLKKTMEFYAALGFETLVHHENFDGANVAFMKNGGCVIEMYEILEGADPDTGVKPAGAIDHIALESTDIEEAYAEAVHDGMTILSNGIEQIRAWEPKSCRFFIVKGPNNERVEFTQIL